MQQRVITETKFEPSGPNVNGPIMQFKLIQVTTHEARRSDRESWGHDSTVVPARQVTILARQLTRAQVSALIADGADWLQYIETEA